MSTMLLTEIHYKLPETGPRAFWEFYALNLLYFRVGSGYEEMYGNKLYPGKTPNIKKQEVIDEVFDICARKLLKEFQIYLIQAAVKEFHHYYDTCTEFVKYHYWYGAGKPELMKKALTSLSDESKQKLEQYRDTAKSLMLNYYEEDADVFYSKVKSKLEFYNITLSEIHKLFAYERWVENYGGRLWANVIELVNELQKRGDSMKLKDVAGYIDKIYDLQHNTGSILNKGRWKVLNTDLNKRRDLTDIREFLPYVGPVVKALIMSSLKYF